MIPVTSVLLAEFDRQFAFLEESSHDEISRQHEVDGDRRNVQITRPEEDEDR
jgi:hypothetical protein